MKNIDDLIANLLVNFTRIYSEFMEILYFVSEKFRTTDDKYVLTKEKPFKENRQIIITPEIILKTNEVKLPNTKPFFREIIKDFFEIVSSNVSKDNLKKLIEKMQICYYFKNYGVACYNPLGNSIVIDSHVEYNINQRILKYGSKENISSYKDNIKRILTHELLHLSSTIYDKEIVVCYSGFSQQSDTYGQRIGVSLNEGYTELLVEKYDFAQENSIVCYQYEKNISYFIEHILGEELMQSFYFKADLQGFVNELSKYSTLKETRQFLINLDKMSYLLKYRKYKEYLAEIVLLNDNINNFIKKSYINRKKIDYSEEIVEKIADKFMDVVYKNINNLIPENDCDDFKKMTTNR